MVRGFLFLFFYVIQKAMILGIDKLHKLVKTQKLVEDLCDRELQNPEGAGFDLRLGEVYELKNRSFLGIDERKTPDMKLKAKFDPKKNKSFVFKPNSYYLMKTIEKVNTPKDVMILFRPRTTIFRSGMMIFTGNAAPGYCGELCFGIANLGPVNVEIELGARVVHAMFNKVDGKTHLYRGQWQHGRTTTKKKEKQV
jgi:deoxycytidine triphosphate deaminase